MMAALPADLPAGLRYVRMGDVELVQELFATLGTLEDDPRADRLYWLTGEVLERWAPEVDWAETEFGYRHDKNAADELKAHAEALKRRRLMREVYAKANEDVATLLAKDDADA
jgi:hypothetical protein